MKTVEFMGMPRAGKTTQIESLDTYLKHKMEKSVRIVYEGERVCPIDKKERFKFNAWSFHEMVNKIMEAQLSKYDYILADRGVYDHMAFSQALYEKGNLTENQLKAKLCYFKEFDILVDAVIVLMISPEKAIERQEKLNYADGSRVVNRDFLSVLNKAYEKLIPVIDSNKKRVVIDTSYKTIGECENDILNFLQII